LVDGFNGLNDINIADLTSRAIFQRVKDCTVCAMSITIPFDPGCMFKILKWRLNFSSSKVLITAILSDAILVTIPKDRMKQCPKPNNWKLKILTTSIALGSDWTLMEVIFFGTMEDSGFSSDKCKVCSLRFKEDDMRHALLLQIRMGRGEGGPHWSQGGRLNLCNEIPKARP